MPGYQIQSNSRQNNAVRPEPKFQELSLSGVQYSPYHQSSGNYSQSERNFPLYDDPRRSQNF